MADIALMPGIWRQQLRPASFRGAGFKVDDSQRQSGRRPVVHEFPKRNTPYSEDMGRKAISFNVTGYIVGMNYLPFRNALLRALEADGPGQLMLPTMGLLRVLCTNYSMREERTRGGMCTFEMSFVEAGQSFDAPVTIDTQYASAAAADESDKNAVNMFNNFARD